MSFEELKRTFLLYKRIPMIVAGGSHSGPIDPNEAVGFVDAKIDEEQGVIRGEPVFFSETFEKVPAELQRRLAHKERVSASLGYELFHDMRKVDHIAIGVDSPVFKDIGFNTESAFQYEETEGINNDNDKKEPKAETATDSVGDVVLSEAQMEALAERIAAKLRPPEPPQETPEEAVIEEVQAADETEAEIPPAAEQEAVQPKPKVEPERVIPKSAGSQRTTPDGMFTLAEGTVVVSTPIGRPPEKKER